MTVLYRGGWLAHPTAAPPPDAPDDELAALLAGWSEHAIGHWSVRCDATWTVSRARSGDAEILVLGLAMDVTAPERGQDAVVERLASALATAGERFYDAIDDLSGAHVLFVRTGARIRVIQDATGMETVAYAHPGDPPLLASYPALIADLRGHAVSPTAQRWLDNRALMAGGFYLPGLLTLYDEVRLLTPNTELHPDEGTVRRFWPRTRIARQPVADIVDQVEPWLRGQFTWLRERHPLTISLTGGVDTRLTLAASRDVAADVGYWTYVVWGKGSHQRDIDVAEQLAQRLGLRHDVHRFRRGEQPDPEVHRAWLRMHGGETTGGALQLGLMDRHPEGHLHVRSNVLETVRGFYLKARRHRPDVVSARMLSLAFANRPNPQYERAFREYMDVTHFTWRSKRNVHWSDLFYWEHRMGAWHGRVVRWLKVSHNTHVIYNSRRVLTAMLGRPVRERVDKVVVFALIRRMWPETLDVPFWTGGQMVDPPPR